MEKRFEERLAKLQGLKVVTFDIFGEGYKNDLFVDSTELEDKYLHIYLILANADEYEFYLTINLEDYVKFEESDDWSCQEDALLETLTIDKIINHIQTHKWDIFYLN